MTNTNYLGNIRNFPERQTININVLRGSHIEWTDLIKHLKIRKFCLYIYIYTILSRCQHRSPWIPLTTILYLSQSWEVFKPISPIGTGLLYIGSSWSSCLCLSMRRGPQEYIAYEFVLTSQAVSCMPSAPNLVFIMGVGWSYGCSFVGSCLQDLYKIAHIILM